MLNYKKSTYQNILFKDIKLKNLAKNADHKKPTYQKELYFEL